MTLVALVLMVIGWAVIVVSAFGSGLNLEVGNLSTLSTGIVFALAGVTLKAFDK